MANISEANDIASLKQRACQEIDRRREDIIAIAEDIWRHPELGYKEQRTAQLVAEQLARLGVPYREGLAFTGVKGRVKGGAGPGPTVAIMGELDAVINTGHPDADPQTGAVHACGHHGQIAAMLGAGFGLIGADVTPALSGDLVLFAVPAEETLQLEWRNELRRQGKIEFLSGKPELIARGEYDDVDITMMVHGTSKPEDKQCRMLDSVNGYFVKLIQFRGRPAHAGGAPHHGINALNAAMLGLSAIHAQRETFRDNDTVRIHPIITKGGDAVNVVPSDVRMETFVRGKTIDAIVDAAGKVDRALRAGAMAVGARVRIETLAGHLPQVVPPRLAAIFKENMTSLTGADQYVDGGHTTGSTDIGDLSQVKATIQPHVGGAVGTGHGSDYRVVNYDVAVINPAKAMAMTAIDLLANGAVLGRRVVAEDRPPMTRDEYLAFMRKWTRIDEYDEGGL
ncbi:MAG: amidohydrolase [Chloroflexi bacterium]|nr:amidohydrolase [Chloroflexota bacterium]